MNIQYISDLHLERQQHRFFFEKNPIQPSAKYLFLAGDIIPLKDIDQISFFLDHISRVFMKVFWLPGNHEFYGSDYYNYHSCNIPIRENVFLINNQSVFLDDFEFIFSTLWSNLDLRKRWFLQCYINDFKYIQYQDDYIDAIDYNNLHSDAVSFLNNHLDLKVGSKTFVITHHCPIMLPLNNQNDFHSAYCSQLDDVILKYRPMFWLYGHTHTSHELIKVGTTSLITNQFDITKNSNDLSKTLDF